MGYSAADNEGDGMTYQPAEIIPCTECGAKSIARRLCKPCYYRLRRKGELAAHSILGPGDVFWSRIRKVGACWEWTGARNTYGYGVFLLPGEKPVRAHRYAYTLAKGPITPGLVVMHSCDNPGCINPSHLSLGSRGDNNRDAKAKGRNASGERHGHARLTRRQVDAIRSDARQNVEIARDYRVNPSHISGIKSGRVWR